MRFQWACCVWGHSRGKAPVAGFQHQTPAWEGALPSIPSGPDPALGLYFCLLFPDLLKLLEKLGFIPLFLSSSPCHHRPPYYFFPNGASKM